ncbi:TIGR01777 family oxidoreductase [Demetria terragena]|uniref:TIGR01777 family oxidoreductase n=1 Tax=Demetria terragena TaxID=63959 RepID=UPI0003735765|nr:TIGR01777 family oxidoreductase [Demetria terragena]
MSDTRQRVAIAGSSGLIGDALSSFLRNRGDEVVHLVRREPESPHEVEWDPANGRLDPESLGAVTAAVNLAGAGIGDKRWTDQYKRLLVSSRVDSTRTLATTLAKLDGDIRLVNGSAMGFYGDRGEDVLDETEPAGSAFLSDLVQQWEAAAQPAIDAGYPVAYARTGLVFAGGGMMERVLPLAKFGLGGPLGSGRQWWSWITLVDEVRALAHLIDHPEITGPVNVVAPNPERQKDVMRVLGRLLGRPAVLPAPKPALRLVLGELSSDILSSQRLDPAVLRESGFIWEHENVESGLRFVLRDAE